jgi:hypothetical protein
MSSGDYIAIQRLQRTLGNYPYVCSSRTEHIKMSTIQCIYDENALTDTDATLNYFDITIPTSLTDCLTANSATAAITTPVFSKSSYIHTPLYIKSQTSRRKFCFTTPTLHGGAMQRSIIQRVCGAGTTET